MVAWVDLFTSDIGLLSLFTILFMVVMAIYIVRYALAKAHDEDAAIGQPPRKPSAGA